MQIPSRTFIISGGSSGLGLATALHLLSYGANISILDLNPPPPSSSSTTPSLSNPSRTLFTPTDVSSSTSLHSALQKTLEWTHSTSRPLGGVICCAGVGSAALALPRQPPNPTRSHNSVAYMDMSHFDKTLAINLRGTIDLIRLTLPHLALNEPYGQDGERGVVIVVSSVAAYEGQVGQVAYAASKGAVASVVLPFAREVGRKAGIRVVGIAPGAFATAMTGGVKSKKENGKVVVEGKGKGGAGEERGKGGDARREEGRERKERKGGMASKAQMNPEMLQYPNRMGEGVEFARLAKEIIENPMLNGTVIRLDGAVRMPSRL